MTKHKELKQQQKMQANTQLKTTQLRNSRYASINLKSLCETI